MKAFSHIEHLCFFSGLCLNSMCLFLAGFDEDTKPHISQRCSSLAWTCMLRICLRAVLRLEYHWPQYLHCSGTLGSWTFSLCFRSVVMVVSALPQMSQINVFAGLWYFRWRFRWASQENLKQWKSKIIQFSTDEVA